MCIFMSATAWTPSNERAARWFLIAAFALVAIGCGSHFRLSRIQPNRTIRGNVLVASLREIGRRLPTAVSFVDARRGFVGTRGGQLLATADAGEHWRVVGRGRHVVSLSFVDRRNGF